MERKTTVSLTPSSHGQEEVISVVGQFMAVVAFSTFTAAPLEMLDAGLAGISDVFSFIIVHGSQAEDMPSVIFHWSNKCPLFDLRRGSFSLQAACRKKVDWQLCADVCTSHLSSAFGKATHSWVNLHMRTRFNERAAGHPAANAEGCRFKSGRMHQLTVFRSRVAWPLVKKLPHISRRHISFLEVHNERLNEREMC